MHPKKIVEPTIGNQTRPILFRLLYVLLGIAFASVGFSFVAILDARQDFKFRQQAREEFENRFRPDRHREINTRELIGTWHGKEDWGTTFTVTRREDGTFSEEVDHSQHNARNASDPKIVKSEGRWSISGSSYSVYYTKSTNPSLVGTPPSTVQIATIAPKRITYRWVEGDWVTERRE